MKEVFLSVEEEIEAAKSIPGVIDFENSAENNFQLLTIEEGTNYRMIMDALYNEQNIEHRKLFICIKWALWDKYIMPHDDTSTFEAVTINAVTAQRYSGALSKSHATESWKRPNFEALLEPTSVPPSPLQIVTSLGRINPAMRRRVLERHTEWQHLWDNKNDYLRPAV